jgi:signal transduction histidine kinase/CheY-like chemotaxis protein
VAGTIVGLSGFTFDVTERRRIEDQLRQAAKMEAVGRLASGIAHDFNNMIGAIAGFASFLVEDLPPATTQRRFAARIAQVCDHAKEVVKQVLAFGRIGDVERRLLDLRGLIAQDEPLLRSALSPPTRLTVDLGSAPLPMVVNAGQVHQVLLNLCLNANDALDGAPGAITITLARLDPGHPDRRLGSAEGEAGVACAVGGQLDPERSYAAIRVGDTGCGMDQATLDRVFEPFYTTKGPGRGTGLGLAVTHGIVTAYAGAYRAVSRRGEGSVFTIYLPLADASVDTTAPTAIDDALRGPESVLLIDDDADMTEMMSTGLERLGYDVTSSNDPVEALQAFEQDPEAWDIVVTDQAMPGMLGSELATRIKARRPGCPVVIYTGYADRAVDAATREPGSADVTVLKPIEPRRVAEHIRRLLEPRRLRVGV